MIALPFTDFVRLASYTPNNGYMGNMIAQNARVMANNPLSLAIWWMKIQAMITCQLSDHAVIVEEVFHTA